MAKIEKYVVKEKDHDPWTSHGFNGVGNLKEVRSWAKDSSLKDGDIIGEFIPKFVFKDGKLKKIS